MAKSPDAFRTISEVADWLGVEAHVLRFWETKFAQVKPVKRAGGRRYYRPSDMALLGGIRRLLHDEGLTIRGVQKLLREQGVSHVAALSPDPGAAEAETPRRGRTPARPSSAQPREPATARRATEPGADGVEAPSRDGGTPAGPGATPPREPAPAPRADESRSDGAEPHRDGVAPAGPIGAPPREPASGPPASEAGSDEAEPRRESGTAAGSGAASFRAPAAASQAARPASEPPRIVDDAPPLPFDLPPERPASGAATTGNGAGPSLAAAFRVRQQRIDPAELATILSRARALAQRLRDTPQ